MYVYVYVYVYVCVWFIYNAMNGFRIDILYIEDGDGENEATVVCMFMFVCACDWLSKRSSLV